MLWLVLALLLLVLLSVLFGWNFTRIENALEYLTDKDVPQLVLKQISVLIALIGFGFGALYFYFHGIQSKIDKIDECHKHVLHLMDTFIKLNIYELPLRSYTQHIPMERFRIFEQLETALGLYENLHPQNNRKAANTAEYKLNFIRGVIAFCNKKTDQSVIYFRKAAKVIEDDKRHETIDALWRLGIAYRQEKQFDKSWETFDKLEGLPPEGSELWSLALRGKMLTKYAQFKNSNNSRIWSRDIQGGPDRLLTEAEQEFETLWRAGFNEPQFVSFYGALIKIESGQLPIVDGINLLQYTINESLVGEKLYPHPEDYAILADFYFSIAVCFDLLYRQEVAENQNHIRNRNHYVKKANKFAELVRSDYGEYDTIYSEKQLREVTADTFISELREWLA